jgi:hypothetical protein
MNFSLNCLKNMLGEVKISKSLAEPIALKNSSKIWTGETRWPSASLTEFRLFRQG